MNADIYLDFFSRGAVNFMPDWNEQRMPDSFRDLEPQAIGLIYDEYFRDVYRYVRYRLNDDHLAEDIAGDVFLNLLEALRKGRGPNLNMRAWLLSTAAHMVTDHLRRVYRRPTESMPDDLLDPGPTPGDQLESREASQDFRQAYALLTDEQQHVLALRFGEGYSLEETAAVLNKKINAVKALQFRALASLQRNIGRGAYE